MSVHSDRVLSRKEKIHEIRIHNLEIARKCNGNYTKGKLVQSVKINSVKDDSNSKVHELIEFSSTPHSEEELRLAFLNNKDVCVSYICRHSPMSEDFIIEFTGLTTGLFNHGNYDKKAAMAIGELMMMSVGDREDIIKLISQYNRAKITKEELPELFRDLEEEHLRLIDINIRDRVDWLYIARYQNISKEFAEKYKVVLKNFIDTPYNYNKPEEY